MSRFQDIYDEAVELGWKNRYFDAAVTFEEARQIAKEYGMSSETIQATVKAANCWAFAGRPSRAYNLLLDVLSTSDVMLDCDERFQAQQRVFELLAYYNPELNKLQQHLERLLLLTHDFPHLPTADINVNQGDLYGWQGKFELAAYEYELAWSRQSERDVGYDPHFTAYRAGLCNLRLGKLESAKDWCKILETTSVNSSMSRIDLYELKFHIALYTLEWQYAEYNSIEADKIAIIFQRPSHQRSVTLMRVRSLLLQTLLGDPRYVNHLARTRLRYRFSDKIYVHDYYSRLLAITDYRLACVRYCLGVPPVDDAWYQQPQQLPTRLPADFQLSDFQRRVQLARRGIHLAQKQAVYLDGCFQCHWRQAEVQQRQTRLDQLVNATQSLFGDSPCSK